MVQLLVTRCIITAICSLRLVEMLLTSLLVAMLASIAAADSGAVTKYHSVDLTLGAGNEGTEATMQVAIPAKGEYPITHPNDLYKHVQAAWNTVVEKNQAGLMDAKHTGPAAPLSPQEAWHHFKASQDGVVDSARFLVTFGVVPSVQSGGTRLHIAAAMGHTTTVAALLDDVDDPVDVDVRKQDGSTPLHLAVTMAKLDTVQLLLDRGANVEAVAKNGCTPLMIAAAMGHVAIAKVLIEFKASVNAKHKFGQTSPLHFAAEMGRAEMIEMLCKHGTGTFLGLSCDVCTAGGDPNQRKATGGTGIDRSGMLIP